MKLASLAHVAATALCLVFSSSLAADEKPRTKAPAPQGSERKIDLNTVELKTLAAMPAIGPEVAQAIVAARPFATIDELNRVSGLTAEQLELIRAQAYVSAPPTKGRLGEPTMEKQPLGVSHAGERRTAAKLDLNTATEAALAAVPTIGPDLARAIVAARPFTSLDELNRLPDLSAERLEQIRSQLTLTPSTTPRPAR